MPSVTVSIVTWNSRSQIDAALGALERSSYKEYEVIVVDNGSSDGTVKRLRAGWPRVRIIANGENRGYAAGHNQSIRASTSEFILLMNPDIIVASDCLERLVATALRHPRAASFGTLLTRPDSGTPPTIDSAGLSATVQRSFHERGTGLTDDGRWDRETDVFGIGGALALLRRSALESVALDGEYLDESFENYKEDVDLAWRLRLAGWGAVFVPTARAVHRRGFGTAGEANSIPGAVQAHRLAEGRLITLSYRNHLLLLTKNEYRENLYRHLLAIVWYELKKAVFLLSVHPGCFFQALGGYRNRRRRALEHRRVALKKAVVGPLEIDQWFQ